MLNIMYPRHLIIIQYIQTTSSFVRMVMLPSYIEKTSGHLVKVVGYTGMLNGTATTFRRAKVQPVFLYVLEPKGIN